MAENVSLTQHLRETHDLEEFCHSLITHLVKERPKAGEDVTRHVDTLGLEVPAVLRGNPITWHNAAKTQESTRRKQTLALTRPGNPEALGFTIGCIDIGSHVTACLECGWLYCRITITYYFDL